jgi:arsenate reductase-like glutaredoxin family protein
MINYVNSARRRTISRLVTLAAIVVIIPAIWTFVNVVKESNFKNDASSFINNELNILPNSNYIIKNAIIQYSSDSPSQIELTTLGNDQISEDLEFVLNTKMKNYRALNDTKLLINQSVFREINNLEYMEELRSRDSMDLLSKTQKIVFLEDKVRKLLVLEKNHFEFPDLTEEVKINYSDIKEFSYSNMLRSNFQSIDTLSIFYVKWNDSLTDKINIAKKSKQLERWLNYKLNLDSIIIKTVD